MRKINFELKIITLLILLSVVLATLRDNGIYLFIGILYSIIIFLVFLFARKKYKKLNKKQIINSSLISLVIIISITFLLGILVVLGLNSFMEALRGIG